MEKKKRKVNLFPDVLTHYRVAAFNAIFSRISADISVYAPIKTKIPGLMLTNSGSGQIKSFKLRYNRNLELGRFCFWQTEQIKAVFRAKNETIVLWGMVNVLSSWIALLIGRLLRKRVVLWSHGIYGREGRVLLLLRLLYYRLADGLLLYGSYSKELLVRHNFSHKKIWVINNALDVDEQSRIRDSINANEVCSHRKSLFPDLSDDTVVGIFVGRLTQQKRLDVIPQLLDFSRRKGIDFRFLFVGSGSEKDLLVSTIGQLGLNPYVVFGDAEYDERALALHFMSSDICVSPGNIGLTCMHSLVYGIPVATNSDIRFQMPESEAVNEGSTGFVFDLNDPDEFVQKLKLILQRRVGHDIAGECISCINTWYNGDYQSRVFSKCLDEVPQTADEVKILPDWIKNKI